MTQSRGRQRLLVLLALVAVVASWALWPQPERPGDRAAAVQSCGVGDANRATLTTAQGRTFRPCLSGVKMRINIPRTQTSSLGCGPFFLQPCYEGKWRISSVSRSSGTQEVKYVGGGSEQLYRITFQQFRIHKDVTFSTLAGAGAPNLTLKPDLEAKVGGTGSNGEVVYTDLWVTGDSSIALDFNFLGIGYTCHGPAAVKDLGIASWLTVSTDGCGLTLDAAYIVTTAGTGNLQGFYSVNLPKTKITTS